MARANESAYEGVQRYKECVFLLLSVRHLNQPCTAAAILLFSD